MPGGTAHLQQHATARLPGLPVRHSISQVMRQSGLAPGLLVSGQPHKASHVPSAQKDSASGQRSPEARAVRVLPFRLITVGKGNSTAANAMAAEWLDKARRYTEVTEVQIKPNPKRSTLVPVQVQAEGEKVLKSIAPGEHVVLLCERGREVTSEGLAQIIAGAGDRGATSLVFCIGGPFGHSDAVMARGNDCIRLSVMVLNHQVAYIVLLEQLYRAWTILRGEPYHH